MLWRLRALLLLVAGRPASDDPVAPVLVVRATSVLGGVAVTR